MRIIECEYQNAKIRMRILECENHNANIRMRILEFEYQNANIRMRILECEYQNANIRIRIIECEYRALPEIRALLNRPWKNKKIFLLFYNHVHQNVALFTLNIIKNSKWLQHKFPTAFDLVSIQFLIILFTL